MKKLLATVLALTLTFGTFALPSAEGGLTLSDFSITASAEESDDYGYIYGDFRYDYDDDDGNLCIRAYVGNATDIVVPSSINGKSVTVIGDSAFGENDKIKSVVIPEGVKTINAYAFMECPNLTSVTLPNSLTYIDTCAFYEDANLTDITIPESVTFFGGSALDKTGWMKKQQEKDPFVIVNNILLNAETCKGDIVIPDNVTSICRDAFAGNDKITSVKILSNVKECGTDAFSYCQNLVSVDYNADTPYIPGECFGNCPSLENVTMSDNIIGIDYSAFSGCSKLKDVTLSKKLQSIEESAFSGCRNLDSINLPSTLEYIGNLAFCECDKLENVYIPASVTEISYIAFCSCPNFKSYVVDPKNENYSSLNGWLCNKNGDTVIDFPDGITDIVFPSSIKTIGRSAFDSAEFEEITIPDTVTKIEDGAFANNSKLKKIVLSKNLKCVGDLFLSWCSSLEQVEFQGELEDLGSNAFSNCSNLKSITLPNGITELGDNLFSSCVSLENVVIPDTVKIIHEAAFYDCDSLTTISLPDGLVCIDDFAFNNCDKLQSIAIPDSVTSIGDDVFTNCNNLTDLKIGSGIKKINYYDFKDVKGIKNLTLSEGLEEISSCAFTNQPNLKYVVIPKSVTSIGERAFGFELYYLDENEENYGYRNVDGFKLGVYAGTAGEEYAKTFNIPYDIIPDHTHSYTSKVTKPATCTENGVRTYTCECGDSYTETIPATGHNYGDFVVTKPATCTEDGVKTKTCANCNDKITESIPKTGHSSSDWIIDKNAAINVKGSKHKECKVCKTVLETAEIPALPMISIQGASVSVSTSSYIFDNTAKTPSVTVTLNGKTLKNGVDYTVTYSNNKNVGLGIVTITGKGDYTGTITKNFKIYPAKQSIQKLETRYKGFFVDWVQKGSATGYEVQYSTSSSMSGAVTKKLTANKPDTLTVSKLKSGKKYYVRVRSYTNVNGEVYYGDWSDVKSITTAKTNFKKAKISGIKTKSYTGKAIKQSIKVTYNGKTLKNGKNYTISYSNNKKVGTAKVTIKGKGTYGGVITKTFKINPAKQKIKSLKAKSKGFTINWAQKDSGTGYEIQYSTNSSFKGATKKTVKNKKTSKATYSKLKAKKKYYVRVRTYTDVNGTRYYGSWSAAKSVTTKK
ncbi:leucine-rich repeat protein [uncultured Ruminococcus sp.]|uniref:leucine-rich repeat protein n=1 Tax=uncultured Ruminococcus sp. TaxID=165186 RepID=UPI002617F901|nr:leucine-rich repeat protein [uncultured Ruminococcus sp.]